MFDVYWFSRVLGSWERIQATDSLSSATEIALRYTRGAYRNDPAWVQVRQAGSVVSIPTLIL